MCKKCTCIMPIREQAAYGTVCENCWALTGGGLISKKLRDQHARIYEDFSPDELNRMRANGRLYGRAHKR